MKINEKLLQIYSTFKCKMVVLGDSAVSESEPLLTPDVSGNSSTQKASFFVCQQGAPNTHAASKFVFQIYISVLLIASF